MPPRRLAFSLPPMALTSHAVSGLSALTASAGGTWLRAGSGLSDQDARWRATVGENAEPLTAPEDAARFGICDGRAALLTQAGVNGGYGLPPWDSGQAGPWSVAILWRAQGDAPALSLFALRPVKGGNNLFLTQDVSGIVMLRDDAGTVSLQQPASQGWNATLLAVSAKGRLSLRNGDAPPVQAQGFAPPPGSARPLIGARSHRQGLKKSLGAAAFAEALFWPGVDIAGPGLGSRLADAFETLCLWEIRA